MTSLASERTWVVFELGPERWTEARVGRTKVKDTRLSKRSESKRSEREGR